MALKLCVLASGSSGNCTFIGTERTRILVDAGLSALQTERRLAEIGETMERIDAICVSHEHADHVAGIRVLQKKYGTPVYANAGTLDALRRDRKNEEINCRCFTTGAPFAVGELGVEPFSVPHDAYEPVGFLASAGGYCVGVATDMGTVTDLIRDKLRRCHAVVIEANHDEEMLLDSPRPWSLKQRIRGNQGHLSNRAAAALAAEIAGGVLRHLFLAHMSSDCNSPYHAQHTFETQLAAAGHRHVAVRLTGADSVSEQVILEERT